MNTILTKKTIDHLGTKMNEHAGSKVSTFAKNQMLKMGWIEGKGLGKNEDGLKTHIKAQKREEHVGLGLDKVDNIVVTDTNSNAKPDNWWHDAYSSNLKQFKGLKDKKDKKKDKKKDRKRSRDDNDDDSSSGMGVVETDKKKKKKRKEVNSDCNLDTPSYDDLFKATGGARLGMRARADQPGKFQRTEHLL